MRCLRNRKSQIADSLALSIGLSIAICDGVNKFLIGWAALTVASAAGILNAQPTGLPSGQGYVFFAPGTTYPGGTAFAHVGVGGQARIYKGFGAGAEVGYASPFDGSGIGVFSANGYYHFFPRTSMRIVDPFVTAGYTLAFARGSGNLVNFGGGATYWAWRRIGLRFEFRDHMTVPIERIHLWQARFGVAFR